MKRVFRIRLMIFASRKRIVFLNDENIIHIINFIIPKQVWEKSHSFFLNSLKSFFGTTYISSKQFLNEKNKKITRLIVFWIGKKTSIISILLYFEQ